MSIAIFIIGMFLQAAAAPQSQYEVTSTMTTRIVKVGTNVTFECYSCNVESLMWKHTDLRNVELDITKEKSPIRKPPFNVTLNSSYCRYDLILINVQFHYSGEFSCWNSSLEIFKTILIVVKDTAKCTFTPALLLDTSKSGSFLLGENGSFIINCSFDHLPIHESCILMSVWNTFPENKNIAIHYEVETKSRIVLKYLHGVDIRKKGYYNLLLDFNCSLLNHILHDRPKNVGNVSLNFTNEDGRDDAVRTDVSQVIAIGIGIAIAVIILVPVVWNLQKRYEDSESQNNFSVLNKPLPKIPTISLEQFEITKDIEATENIYEVLE